MGKNVAIFLLTWVLVSIGIVSWRNLVTKEKLAVAKAVLFGFVTSVVAAFILAAIVVLF